VTPLGIRAAALEATRRFFEDRGAEGCEGTALIARVGDGAAERLVIPRQVAQPVPNCWVEVPYEGKLELAAALRPDETYAVRIHSHPGTAFHSATDDSNPVLTQEGALSIVVPFFGLGLRRGLDACAVFARIRGRWREIPPGPERARWVEVVP
jgi:hypothetical protein